MTGRVLREWIGTLFADRRFRVLAALLVSAALTAAAYRIALVGVAENFARSDPGQALRLSPGLPVALRARAEQLRAASPRDSAQIERLLRDSLSTDPVDGRSFGLLGLEAAHQGRAAEADRLLDAGIRRAPRDIELRTAAISRSLHEGRLREATRHIIAVLRVRTERSHEYVGWLSHVYSGSAEGREVVKQMALAPSRWRSDFLAHVAAYAAPSEALHLMGVLKRRKLAASAGEYDAVVRTLLSRREWRAAFALWMQDPARSGDGKITNLYNGDFSRTLQERPGFDWELVQPTGTRVRLEESSGGQRHLRVDFFPRHDATAALARHLLVLGAGSYELRARARSQGLDRGRAPLLTLSCLHPAGSTHVATLKLRRRDSRWHVFSASAQIPGENCPAQELEVRLDLPTTVGAAAAGTLWLDDVAVVRARANRARPTGNPEIHPASANGILGED